MPSYQLFCLACLALPFLSPCPFRCVHPFVLTLPSYLLFLSFRFNCHLTFRRKLEKMPFARNAFFFKFSRVGPFGLVSAVQAATCGHLPHRPLAATCGHLRPLAATCGHLQPLAATCGHLPQRPLAATRGHLRPLAATCGHLRPLAATCSHLRPLAATCGPCGHLRPLAATCGHLRPLAATCGHLRPLALAATCGHLRPLALAATCSHLQALGCFFEFQIPRVLQPQCQKGSAPWILFLHLHLDLFKSLFLLVKLNICVCTLLQGQMYLQQRKHIFCNLGALIMSYLWMKVYVVA